MTDIATQNSSGRTQSGFEKNSFNQEPENTTSRVADGATEAAKTALDKGRQLATVAGAQAKYARAKLTTRVRNNPLSSVGIAFGVAFGAGAALAMLRK